MYTREEYLNQAEIVREFMPKPDCEETARMLEYAATLKAAQGGVTEAMVEAPLAGRWHHGNGALCCGSFRIARADWEAGVCAADGLRDQVFDWIVATLNCPIAALSAQQGQGEDDAEARSHARMIHDFPRLSAFFGKHALGSKSPVSCFACGHVGERAITHAELADIYVCKTCAEKITAPPAQPAELAAEYTRGRSDGWDAAKADQPAERVPTYWHPALKRIRNQLLTDGRNEHVALLDALLASPAPAPARVDGGEG